MSTDGGSGVPRSSHLSRVLAEVKHKLAEGLAGTQLSRKRSRPGDSRNGLSSDDEADRDGGSRSGSGAQGKRGGDKTPIIPPRVPVKCKAEEEKVPEKPGKAGATSAGTASALTDSALVSDLLRRVGPLSSLTAEDWDTVLHPVAELRPYLSTTATAETQRWQRQQARSQLHTTRPVKLGSGDHHHHHRGSMDGGTAVLGDDSVGPTAAPPPLQQQQEQSLLNYVKCRAAELPMRLQAEAMQLRRHEQNVRTHMKELLQLSEFLTYVDHHVPAEMDSSGPRSGGNAGTQAGDAVAAATAAGGTLGSLELLLSPVEAQRRVVRAKERVGELEELVRAQARDRVRCAERMVLLSGMTALLVERVAARGAPDAV